jgi:HTH-type transcriptional regulator, sugar sensing transcriptional regulator
MKELEQTLKKLGFHEKKASIYIALLELGEGSIIELAKKTGLKRTTVYNILPEMVQEGLVRTGVKKKHRFFFIENPNNLKQDYQDKIHLIDKLLPELRAIHNIIPHKPKITFYEGVGGMKELYQDTLDSLHGGDIILSYTGFKDYYKFMPREYMDWYVEERVRRKIRIRMIVPDFPTTREILSQAQSTLREIKVVPEEKWQFSADTEIYANKVALISHTENFMGVILESKEINLMQRMAFEIMWNALK